ncbi:MAG: class I SAM-dependent DNA methyltransferase [Promethearchaeota archaeon]
MTSNSLNELTQILPYFISSVQESILDQIIRIGRRQLTDLDGKKYQAGTHHVLERFFNQTKKPLGPSSIKKVRSKVVLYSTLNYLAKLILSKYMKINEKSSKYKLNLPNTDFDYFYPSKKVKTDISGTLTKYNIKKLNIYQIGILYQEILKLCQLQQTLGAFYTPKETVDYMVSKLDLSSNPIIIDPACGNGQFLEGCISEVKRSLRNEGYSDLDATKKAISHIWGIDVDPFAVLLSTLRIFFLSGEYYVQWKSNVFNFDTLDLKNWIHFLNGQNFDCIIGNPPYGRKSPSYLKNIYKQIYHDLASVYGYKLGANDLYTLFLANAIHNVKNNGTICFILSDTFLSLKSHTILRRLILDTCKINEILLAPIDLFRPMTTSRTCIITLTKRLCEKGYSVSSRENNQQNKSHCDCDSCSNRKTNKIKLIDRLKTQNEYFRPPKKKVKFINQEEYEWVKGTPFWVNVDLNFIQIMRLCNSINPNNVKNGWKYEELREHIIGGEGLSTGDNYGHLVIIKGSKLWEDLHNRGSIKLDKYRILGKDKIIDLSIVNKEILEHYRLNGINGDKFLVPFERGSYYPYWGSEGWYIDWSPDSVKLIKTRARDSKGRQSVFRNPDLYFRRGITTNAHHGVIKATLVEYAIVAGNSNLFYGSTLETEFVLGYLNSKLASYFLGKIINTTLGGMSGHATPEDFKRLPVRIPEKEDMSNFFNQLKSQVIEKVKEIINLLKKQPKADFSKKQEEIDELIFDWFDLDETEKNDVNNYLNQSNYEKKHY